MFALPVSVWLTGGVFQEHTHRLWATVVGVLIVSLTRWIGGRKSRLPLAIIGLAEIGAGLLLPLLGPEWKGAGYFLSGIGGVVLLAALVWARNAPAARPLPGLVWVAFWLVQLQGLLGGLRVVLDAHVFAGTKLGVWFGVFHGCLAQVFLVLIAVIALLTSRRWVLGEEAKVVSPKFSSSQLHWLLCISTGLIFLQLLLGATMRHQHAGLAIPDFPLAYGSVWPDLSPDAVARYNQQRIETVALNPITSTQIVLQMVHRMVACSIVVLVLWCFFGVRKAVATGSEMRRLAAFWVVIIAIQFALGAWTVWSNKAADVASLHVVCGALSLVTGGLICVCSARLQRGVVSQQAEPQTALGASLLRREAGAIAE
jgi:cytochrome c oxidase assembly protein subunit 15